MKSKYIYSTLSTLGILLLTSCVTTKSSKEETGWLKRQIHDVNARYNGYFNAKELYNSSYASLVAAHSDNYNQILPIYPIGTVEERKAVEDDMDLAIDKVVKVASIHETSKWVDDCYVMMGKAQFLKGDYESAQETLEYFAEDFNPSDPTSRVYVSNKKTNNSKEQRKEAQKKREEEKKTKEEERKQKEKERKELEKQRKKERDQREKERKQRQRDRKKGKRTTVTPKPTTASASADTTSTLSTPKEAVVLDEDDQYLLEVAERERQQAEAGKKEQLKQGQKGGFLKHKSAYYEGIYWLARTYIERDKYIEANYFLTELEKNPNVPTKIKEETAVARAEYFLRQKDYQNGITAINTALDQKGDKRIKARMAYILAQAYQMNGQASEASSAYARVGDYKTDYEMKINAELNQIKNQYASGAATADQTVSKLGSMVKQDKNRLYQGPIYASKAEIQLVNGDKTGAMESFSKALETSSNKNVKGDIYYRLSDLYFAQESYKNAKLYIDSALVSMDEKDPRFKLGEQRSVVLKDIARNIDIIETQDSLLKIGGMSEAELQEYARAEAKKKWNEKSKNNLGDNIKTTTTVLSGNSKFFAYNEDIKQKGRQEFLKKWGDRPLVDNWRRSNRADAAFEEEIITDSGELEVPDNLLEEDMQKIIRDLPTTPEAIATAEASIEQAMFELGTGYRTNLNNYRKSNETLLAMLDRFPKTANKPEALYFLHLNFLDLENGEMAESYKIRLTREFPESPFSKYLKDPSNSDALVTKEREISLYYDQTYKIFERGAYKKAYDRLVSSEKKYGTDHHMTPKFELLKAMCIGNTESKNDYVDALRSIILRYDNTPEQTYARELLRFLKGDGEAFANEDVTDEDLSKYVIEDDRLHYVMLVAYKTDNRQNEEIKKNINNYNDQNFSEKRLKVSNIILNKEDQSYVFLIRRFPNKKDAMAYYRKVSADGKSFVDPSRFSYDLYAANQKNYRKINQEKKIGAYKVFFDRQYLGIK